MTLWFAVFRRLFFRRVCASCGIRLTRFGDPYCSRRCAEDDD